MASSTDVLVLGAGAAGLFCALTAGNRRRRVLVLEHQDRIGKKILISGGGRCNFTNTGARPENFLSGNPHFCKSALSRFTPSQFIQLVQKHHIPFHEKKLGQLFCSTSSKEIVHLLEEECRQARVQIQLNSPVEAVEKTDRFQVSTPQGIISTDSLVIATGGLSFPQIGATDFGYRVAEQFGLTLTRRVPALVPLTFSEQDRKSWGELSGVSVDVRVECGNKSFRENILFTHRGLSGPAILQISSYWEEGDDLVIDLLPDMNVEATLLERKQKKDRSELKNVLSGLIPSRLAERWCEELHPSKPMINLSDKEIRKIAEDL